MRDLPRSGLEPLSPALAGGFLTTVQTGKSPALFLSILHTKLTSVSESLSVLYTLPKPFFFQIFHGCLLLIIELLSLTILTKITLSIIPPQHYSLSLCFSFFIIFITIRYDGLILYLPILGSEIYEGRDSVLFTVVPQHLELCQAYSTCTINIS